MKKIILPIILITLLAILIAYFLGFPNMSGISPVDLTDIERINNRYPLHIVNPEFVSPEEGDTILFKWCVAEAKARLALILIVWLISVIILIMLTRNKKITKQSSGL